MQKEIKVVERIKKSDYLKNYKNEAKEVRSVHGRPGMRLLVYPYEDGTELYEGQYLYYFSGEWITPFGGEWHLYLYKKPEDALTYPKQQVQMCCNKMDRSYIMQEQNVEKRRKLMEYMGSEEFIKRLDVVLIHEETDSYNKPMKLYRTKNVDNVVNKHLYFLMVTDTSTDRMYYLSVRPSTTCTEAKNSTFNGRTLYARQGDVGVIKIDETKKEHKIIET